MRNPHAKRRGWWLARSGKLPVGISHHAPQSRSTISPSVSAPHPYSASTPGKLKENKEKQLLKKEKNSSLPGLSRLSTTSSCVLMVVEAAVSHAVDPSVHTASLTNLSCCCPKAWRACYGSTGSVPSSICGPSRSQMQ